VDSSWCIFHRFINTCRENVRPRQYEQRDIRRPRGLVDATHQERSHIGKLSHEDIAEIECPRVVAVATNLGTIIAINWLCVKDSD